MNRYLWISAAVIGVLVVGVFVFFSQPPVPVQISTDNAKVSIGPGGVSISVASSAE